MAYDPKNPTRPVPLERQAEFAAITAERWYELYDYMSRTSTSSGPLAKYDPFKFFDVDAALTDTAVTMRKLGRMAELTPGGSVAVQAWLDSALEKLEARTAVETGAAA